MIKQLHPELFQGNLKKVDYFEGWYFKHTDSENHLVFCLIPGVSLNPGDSHAFIQLLDGTNGKTYYFRFPLESFVYDPSSFSISIGENQFSAKRILVDITEESFHFRCDLTYRDQIRYPSTLFSPGIMGWYSFVPFMECNHGVVSVDHKVSGECRIGDRSYTLEDAQGYIEKDWGTSFPERWIWMQCNTFDMPGTSFMLSYATIPWLGKAFNGLICFLYVQGRIHTFATYSHATIRVLSQESNAISICCSDKEFDLTITATADIAGSLTAPVKGAMTREIFESLTAVITLELHDKQRDSHTLLKGIYGGLEMCGEMD